MHGHQLGAVRKRGFDLDIWNHFGDAIHHIGFGEHMAAFAHELRDGFAIPCTFHHSGADEGDRFWVVELQSACFAALGQQGSGEEKEFVFFAGGEFHEFIILELSLIASALTILVHVLFGALHRFMAWLKTYDQTPNTKYQIPDAEDAKVTQKTQKKTEEKMQK